MQEQRQQHKGIEAVHVRSQHGQALVSLVLAVLYLMFNEVYLASSGTAPTRRDLTEDAAWLTALVSRSLS